MGWVALPGSTCGTLIDPGRISRHRCIELDVERDLQAAHVMHARSGRRTVPQVIIDPKHVGGVDELQALEETGRLDALLEAVQGPKA